MRRRRVVVVAVIAIAAVGATWWLLFGGLSAEERRLVGTWRHGPVGDLQWTIKLVFEPNGRCLKTETSPYYPGEGPPDIGIWSAREASLAFDAETAWLKRAIRPAASLLPLEIAPVCRCVYELDGNRLTFINPDDGTRSVWIRDPAN
jgi:hypothetical protein